MHKADSKEEKAMSPPSQGDIVIHLSQQLAHHTDKNQENIQLNTQGSANGTVILAQPSRKGPISTTTCASIIISK